MPYRRRRAPSMLDAAMDDMTSPSTGRLERRGRGLELATFGWNTLEIVMALATGLAAHSLALIAFGLDSGVEVFGSIVVLWHLRAPGDEGRARRATRLITASFVVLGVYLGTVAVLKMVDGGGTESSPVGVAFMAATVAVMFGLAFAKHRTAAAIRSSPLHANAHMTGVDGALAAGVLLALIARIVVGWEWVDPVAAAVVAVAALNEARAGWSGEREV